MRAASGGILRTTALRVAAVYAILYALLTATIVIVVFSLAEHQIYEQIEDGLVGESTALSSLLSTKNTAAIEQIVRRHHDIVTHPAAGPGIHGERYYLLSDADGNILVGDLAAWPGDAPAHGWYRFRTPQNNDVLALISTLPNGMHLLVGQSLAAPKALGTGVRTWVIVGAGLALLAGLGGGAAVGAQVMRRIREAGATAEQIQAGRLSERLPRGGPTESALLARSFNAMLDRIEMTVLGLRDLAARTAHEMKHPLARADRALARAQDLAGDPSLQAELATARGEVAALAHRIDALLRLARIEAGDKPEYFRDVDLAKLVSDVADLYLPLVEESGRSLSLDTPAELRLSGDRQLLAQALANLIENAIRYSPPERGITVRLHGDTRDCIIEVVDAGAGPVQQECEVISTSDRTPGGGLGLPIVRAIARLHGGDLELDRRETSFSARMRLPRFADRGRAHP